MAELLAAAAPIPISQLTPDLHAASTRCIKAIVTLIWPYSSSTSTLKVLLAEPDFRLRRTRGQVRVQFSGSSARSVFETGIGSGDEVILSLDGADWTKDESAGQTPGRSIDWELKFSERLVLKIQQNESDKTSLLDIDHPIPISQPDAVQDIPEPEPLPSPLKSTASKAGRPELIRSETNEWSSPAFVKRARVSYGSLFESGYNIFAEEDGTIEGKGRKRARFGRKSGAWRYSSRSQSPEPSRTDEDMADSGSLEPGEEEKPVMTDEGCQTLGLEDDNAAEALADLSRQQVTSLDDSIVADDRLGIYDVRVSEPVGVPDRSEASLDTQLPPIPHITLQNGNQEISKRQPQTQSIEAALATAETDIVPSNNLHPLDQSAPIAIEATNPAGPVEIEDLYGLSPTADGYPRNATPEANVDQIISNLDDAKSTSVGDIYEHSHQIGGSHNPIAYAKLLSRSISPEKVFDSTLQAYPEPDVAGNHDFTGHSGPYYGEQFQSYADIDSDHILQPSEVGWQIHPNDTRSPNTISQAEHEMSHDGPMQKLLARHLSPGGVAMSRSQSGHSEMVDLTEDSDEDGDGLAGGSQTGDDEETKEQFYRNGRVEDQSSDEEEGYENLLSEEDGSESVGNEFEHDDEDNIRHPPGFYSIKPLAPGEVADDDEDEEEEFEGYEIEEEEFEEEEIEEGSYEYDGASDEEDDSTAIDQPLRSEPEVIDLLSSDEEDGKDDDTSRDPSAPGESAAIRLNETDSMFVEEEGSKSEAESDVENSDEEVIEDGYAEGDLLKETHSPKPATIKELGGLADESTSEEDESEDANGMKSHENISGLPSNATDENRSFQDMQFNTGKLIFTAQSQLTGFGGHDGTLDSPDHLLIPPQEADEVEPTANANSKVPMSGDVTYPVLPIAEEDQPLHQEKSTQDGDAYGISKNDQLPTPDATQLSATMVSDTSFKSPGSFQQLLDGIDFTEHIVSDTQDSLQQEPEDGLEEVSIQASVDRTITDAHEDAARDSFADDTATVVEESFGAVARIEAKDAKGNSTIEVPTDSTQEISTEQASCATSNATAYVTTAAITEATQPAPVTPRRSKRLSFNQQHRELLERSPSINMDEPTTPDDYDASVELAVAALDSPSKQHSDVQQLSDKQLRVMLSRPLRTNLGDFTTLKLARFNLEKKLDFLAIVTTHPSEPQRAKSGLRHYHLRFNVTDATIAPSGVLSANIFRPYKTALPTVFPGEVVLLRKFLVKSEKGAGFTLRSDEGSSWVVFKHGGEEEVKGPPVEYGDGEREHVVYLKAWYRHLDLSARERLENANGEKVSDMGRSMGKVF